MVAFWIVQTLLAFALPQSTISPVPVQADWWQKRHAAVVDRVKQGNVDLIFVGDSITHAFGGDPHTGESFLDRGKDSWDLFYGDRKAVNLGFSGDRTQHVLWRLQNGEMQGIRPKVAVVMIGTNNVGSNTPQEIAVGVEAVCDQIRKNSPTTKVLLLGIFPRGKADSEARSKVNQTNVLLASWASQTSTAYLNFGKVFLDANAEITDEIMPDKLHPFALGYRLWAMAMEPSLAKLLRTKPKTTDSPYNRALVPVTQNRDIAMYDWMPRHLDVKDAMQRAKPRLVFIGDSITHRWGGAFADAKHQTGRSSWEAHFAPLNAGNIGFGWDRTENVLWRLEQGELDGVNPQAVVLLIGTNNLGLNTPEEIQQGVLAIVKLIRSKAPSAAVLVLGVLPRGERPDDPIRRVVADFNGLLSHTKWPARVRYMDIGKVFLEPDGSISKEVMSDYLHPTAVGYERFAVAIEPAVRQMMKLK